MLVIHGILASYTLGIRFQYLLATYKGLQQLLSGYSSMSYRGQYWIDYNSVYHTAVYPRWNASSATGYYKSKETGVSEPNMVFYEIPTVLLQLSKR